MYGKRSFILFFIFISLLSFYFCKGKKGIPEKSIDDLAIEINNYFVDSSRRLIKLSGQIQSIMNKDINYQKKKKNMDRFRPFDNSVYYNPKKKDECSFWYSGPADDKNILTKLFYHERFEQYIMGAAGNGQYSNSVFMISTDNIIISYPYINFLVYLSPETDFRVLINRLYKKNLGNNKWTSPYLDVMGTGYVSSYTTYILKNKIPKFKVLIDISIPELYNKTIKHSRTPMMIMHLPHYLIAVNKSCRELFNISGRENKFYLKDVKVAPEKDALQNVLLDKEKDSDLFEVLKKIEGKSSVNFSYSKDKYKVVKKKIDTPGWLLLGFIKI